MAGAGKVEIINIALRLIGAKPIESVSEASVASEAAVAVWEACVRDTLGDHKWDFATVVVNLAEVSNYTPLGYTYAYGRPSNCLTLWLIYNDTTVRKNIGEYFRTLFDSTNNQRVIVTDCEDAYAEYTAYIADTTLFSPKFVLALAHKLAATLAVTLTGDADAAKAQGILYTGVISEAKRIGSYENNAQRIEHNPIVDARG